MAKYTLIWNELKLKHRVSVAMNPRFHSNLVRMLSVEKNRDVGFKLALDVIDKKAIMTREIEGSKVTFILTLYESVYEGNL